MLGHRRPNQHFHVQIQQKKHQNNVINLLKVNKKDKVNSSGVFVVSFEEFSHILLVFTLLT